MQIRGITRIAHDSKLRSAAKACEKDSDPTLVEPAQFMAKGIGTINKAHHKVRSPREYAVILEEEKMQLVKAGFRVRSHNLHVLPR